MTDKVQSCDCINGEEVGCDCITLEEYANEYNLNLLISALKRLSQAADSYIKVMEDEDNVG